MNEIGSSSTDSERRLESNIGKIKCYLNAFAQTKT
jgi:hypothetical protein